MNSPMQPAGQHIRVDGSNGYVEVSSPLGRHSNTFPLAGILT